jgi:hypothetical protein
MPKQQTDVSHRAIYLWIAFGFSVLLGQVLYQSLTFWIYVSNPQPVLLFILALQVLLTALILHTTGLLLRSIILCLAGISIGSWGALLSLIVRLGWSIRGFAP